MTVHKLGRFGHHPDPAIDFCIEVDNLKEIAHDVGVGLQDPEALEERLTMALQFRVGGDLAAVEAMDALRSIMSEHLARTMSRGAYGLLAMFEHAPELLDAVLEQLRPRLVSDWRKETIWERVPMVRHRVWDVCVFPFECLWFWRVEIARWDSEGENVLRRSHTGESSMEVAQHCVDDVLREFGYLVPKEVRRLSQP